MPLPMWSHQGNGLPDQLIFVLGGARSGKSSFAERLALRRGGRVLYAATAEPLDDDMKRRIAAHRRQRPPDWTTLEEPLALSTAIPPALQGHDTCLLDCLTLWVSNMLLSMEGNPLAEREIVAAAHRLIEVYEQTAAAWIVVSNEVGLGVVPPSALGAAYRDALGRVNQIVAARADKVYFMAAGLALELKALGAVPYACLDLRVE